MAEDENVDVEAVDFEPRGFELQPEELRDIPAFDPPAKQETPYLRETTARLLGLGVFWAFAGAVLCICIVHGIAMWILIEPPPAKFADAAQAEVWFRWREQVTSSTSSLAQTVGALLAGPFGVVLGFYFRDRQ